MASLNKVMIIGHLGKDPELRYTQSGKAVASFSVATSESWKDKGGQKQENTEWHNVVVWDKMAENAKEYLAKGSSVYIEGSLKTQSWDKDGQKHYKTEKVGQRMQFLSKRNDNPEGIRTPDDVAPPPADEYDGENLPF